MNAGSCIGLVVVIVADTMPPRHDQEHFSKMNALALESLLEILVSVMLLTWTAAVIWGNVLFFLVWVAAVDVEEEEEEEEEDGRPITAVGVLHVLLFLVVIGLVILESLLDRLNWTIAFVVAGYGAAISLVLTIGVEEVEEVEENDGVEDDGVKDDGDGCPSGTIIQTEDSAWTLEDGCSAGDAIEADGLRVEEDNDRPITATLAIPFRPRRSPRLAAQTQTRVEFRRSPRLAANRKRADSLRNAGSQPRRSARLAAVRLTRGM